VSFYGQQRQCSMKFFFCFSLVKFWNFLTQRRLGRWQRKTKEKTSISKSRCVLFFKEPSMENVKSVFFSLICFASLIFLVIQFMVATLIGICWSWNFSPSLILVIFVHFKKQLSTILNFKTSAMKDRWVIKRIFSNKNNKLFR
jgi:hypothetical protein